MELPIPMHVKKFTTFVSLGKIQTNNRHFFSRYHDGNVYDTVCRCM